MGLPLPKGSLYAILVAKITVPRQHRQGEGGKWSGERGRGEAGEIGENAGECRKMRRRGSRGWGLCYRDESRQVQHREEIVRCQSQNSSQFQEFFSKKKLTFMK